MYSKIADKAAVSLVTLGVLFVTACSTSANKPAETAQKNEIAAPVISDEARKVLTLAEDAVDVARRQFALWTTATAALATAREAAQQGDSITVISQANFAIDQVKLGMAQLSYPSTEKK